MTAPAPLLLDTFTAANGTDPASRDMDVYPAGNSTWVNTLNKTVINNGLLKLTNIGTPGKIYGEWPSHLFPTGSRCFVVSAFSDAAPSTATLSLNTYETLGPGNAQLRLLWVQSVAVDVDSYDDSAAGGALSVADDWTAVAATHKLALWANGSRVVVIVDGAIKLDGVITIGTQTLNGFEVEQSAPSSASQGVLEVAVYSGITLAEATSLTA